MSAYEADYVTRDGRLVIDQPEVRSRLAGALDGYTALYHNTADFNTAFGSQTLVYNTTGANNTAVGSRR